MARTPASRQMLALLLILFAGCGNMPEKDISQIKTTDLYEQARGHESRGNLLEAAQNYQLLAERNASPAREGHLLEAANLLSRGHHNDRAKTLIATINTKQLTTDQNLRLRLINARIAMDEKQPRAALEQLQLPTSITLPADLQLEWYTLKAAAATLTASHLEAVRAHIELGSMLHGKEVSEGNQQQLWQALNQLSDSELKGVRRQPPPDLLSGWLDLATLARPSPAQATQFDQQLAQWRSRYPHHPARESLVVRPEGNSRVAVSNQLPGKIALLLPLSGSFSNQAAAVRDGFMAAYYARRSSNYNPTIRVYDTTDNVETGMTVYRQALDEGASFIVGPLHKPLLERITGNGKIQVPTLALNYLSDESVAVSNLYQYGLLPEGEARQVAERAAADGHSRALALIPTGEWGDRMLATFSKAWQQLGGRLLEVQRYDASQHDFSEPVTNLLNIDRGRARYSALKSTLGMDIKFDGRRRQDADFVFVAAFPTQARQIRPQLRFHFAGDLPIYSTSHAFSGEANPNQDRDLDGIIFCDMPWTLTNGEGHKPSWEEITNTWKASAIPFKRLYAMGIDAYTLMVQFNTIGSDAASGISAESGLLYRDGANRIHRQLEWARFRNGKPVLIDGAGAPQDPS